MYVLFSHIDPLIASVCFSLSALFSFQTFGRVAVDDDTHINRNCNFQTFFMAVLVLFR